MTRVADIIESRDREETFIAGLLQEPRRLVELTALAPERLAVSECRAVYRVIRAYHEQAAKVGRVRYATLDIAERETDKSLAVPVKDKERQKKRAILRKACARLLTDLRSLPRVTEDDFKDAVDQIVRHAQDESARAGLIELVGKFEQKRSEGLYQALNALARDIGPMGNQSSQVGLWSDDARNVWMDYQRVKTSPGTDRILTPFPRLNQLTRGGKPGRLWLIAAYTADGKTQLSKEFVYHGSTIQGKGAVVITGEQSKSDVRLMLTVRHSHLFYPGGLDFNRVEAGELNPKEEKALRRTIADLAIPGKYGPIRYWQAPGGTTMSDVRAMLDYLSRQQPIDIVMLDHTMLFEPTISQRSPEAKLAEVIRESKQIALDFDNGKGLWMIAPHQIKRDGYEKAMTRGFYLPSDCAGSAEAERSADVLVWSWRDEQLKEVNELRMGIAKNRYGMTEPQGWHVWERFSNSAVFPIEV